MVTNTIAVLTNNVTRAAVRAVSCDSIVQNTSVVLGGSGRTRGSEKR